MNNVKFFPNTGAIKDEAAVWVVRLHGQTYKTGEQLSPEQADELRAWMSQSDEHRYQFLKMLSAWDAMGMLEELADILPLSDINSQRSATFSLRRYLESKARLLGQAGWGRGLSAVAASLVLVVGLSFYLSPRPLEFSTEVGQQMSYSLQDGSEIRLNTNSKVRVDFSDEQRVVYLQYGEAHFDVAKDADRPFVVYAGDGMVLAVGTAFNVQYEDSDSVNVIVSEGTVKVFSGVTQRNQEPLLLIDSGTRLPTLGNVPEAEGGEDYFREVVLEAGEAALYSQRRVVKEPIDEQVLLEELAWRDGILVFQGETLAQALAEISRYTNRELVIVDPAIRDTSVGGRFKTNDIEALASSLALGLNIQAQIGEGDSILFSAK